MIAAILNYDSPGRWVLLGALGALWVGLLVMRYYERER